MANRENAPFSKDRGATILLVDDEEAIREILRAQLTARGYLIFEASTGNEALRSAPALRPDVILLDLGLPDMDGIEVTKRLRGVVQTPIIILSVRASTSDKIAALDAGADDYLTKPCQSGDLMERIRMALLRTRLQDAPVFEDGDLCVDLSRHMVHIRNHRIQLTGNEYDLLKVLVLNAGRLMTQRRLAHEVWADKSDEEAAQLLRTAMSTLRQKLEANLLRPPLIAMEPGVGYRLRLEP